MLEGGGGWNGKRSVKENLLKRQPTSGGKRRCKSNLLTSLGLVNACSVNKRHKAVSAHLLNFKFLTLRPCKPTTRVGHSLELRSNYARFLCSFLFELKKLPFFPHPFTCKKGKHEQNSSALEHASAQICLQR
jgi:hypothetical protein